MNTTLPNPPPRPGTPMPGLGLERPTSPNLEAVGGFFERVWKWIQSFFLDYTSTLAYGVGLVGIGILVSPAIPSLLIPCVSTGIGLMTSALVTKTMKRYTFVPLSELQYFSVNLAREYPQVHIMAFITTIFINSVCPPIAFAAGLTIGLVSGFNTQPTLLDNQNSGGHAPSRLKRGPSYPVLLCSIKA